MKARQPKLKTEHLAVDSINVQDFIINDCASYAEAAEFFGVDKSTIDRWMMGRTQPHPTCYRAIAAYKRLQVLEAA